MPIISNSIQNNGGSSQGIRSQTRTYRSGNSTLHLREGQTLRVSLVISTEMTLPFPWKTDHPLPASFPMPISIPSDKRLLF